MASKYTPLRVSEGDGIAKSTRRTSWMANNPIPDSIIMNMICRSLAPLVEPKVRSTIVTVALTSKNTLRILNTIKPVIRVLTTMDIAKLVRTTVLPQAAYKVWPCTNVIESLYATQAARGNKLKSAYQIKTDWFWLTQVYDCQEWRNDHDTDILTPHDPTTVDLWRFRWIPLMIGTMVYAYYDTLRDEVTTPSCYGLDNCKVI